jgi:ectoine hydroxylase-related dioxygenase (phytanoyl-CoA dioxygenase family)
MAFVGQEPYAVQTMIYFKPPGARGAAPHQDQAFLRVQPGTCVAAWMALERSDEENGCMRLVPGSHQLPFLCPSYNDGSEYLTTLTVRVPESVQPEPVIMEAGDVLVFNGLMIHGSKTNTSTDRFRCSLIGHYIQAEAEKVGKWYKPVLRFDGSEVTLGVSEGGGPCGVWAEDGGRLVVDMREEGEYAALTE